MTDTRPVPPVGTMTPGGTPTRPWPIRLSEHVWQVAGAGITHQWDAAAYLIADGEPILVDCGSPLGIDALTAALTTIDGITPDDLLGVIGTHGHFDHVGGAATLAAAGVPFHLHPADAGAVEAGDPVLTCAGPLYGHAFPPATAQPLIDGQQLTAGGARLEILHTPGHTPGSVCVVVHVDGLRILLAGDTLYGGFSPEIGSDALAWRASLQRLAITELDFLTFGHGVTRLLADPAGRIAEALLRFGSYYDPWFRPPRYEFRY